jgi:hypothetical protein
MAPHPSTAVPRCPACGYDLSGIGTSPAPTPQPRCPECGTPFDPGALRALPELPGFWHLCWVCLRPAMAYLALVLLAGLLIARKPAAWGMFLACAGPPALLVATLATVVHYATLHYVARDRWWVVFLMLVTALGASAAVGLLCSLGLGAV